MNRSITRTLTKTKVVLLALTLALTACTLSVTSPSAWAGDTTGLRVQELSAQSTPIQLYRVSVSGGIGGTIGVGDTLSANATKIKQVTGSTSTVEAAIEDGDEVAYQWQYANTSTTTNSAFTDIEGATEQTFTIPASMQGKYLRVKAISSNEVVSTSKPYYGTTQSVAPVGPVQEAAGAVELSSVALVSSMANSMWVGATVTPTAKYYPQNSYLEQAVPPSSEVTYTWKVADSAAGPFEAFDAATYTQSSVSASGELLIGADLEGKYMRVEANAHVNTVMSLNWPVMPQGVYDLMRITFGEGPFYTGDTVVTTLQGKTLEYQNDASFGTTIPIDDPNTSYQWYFTTDEPVVSDAGADFSTATWTAIEGATKADLAIPTSISGAYFKVVATSAKNGVSSSVERACSTKVLSKGDLSTAPDKLASVFFHPNPRFGEATNVNDLVEAKLVALGYEGVTAKVKSWQPSAEDPLANLGISTADDDTNGDVTFFSYEDVTARSYHSFTSERQVHITFELSRGAETPVEYSVIAMIPWDRDKAQKILDEQVEGLAIGFADGEDAQGVTQNMTLPCQAGFVYVTWKSSNEDALAVTGQYSFEDYTGVVHRSEQDVEVVLTATADGSIIDTSDESLADLANVKEFPITITGDANMIAQMNEALAATLDATFVYDNVTISSTGGAVDTTAVKDNLQLPRSSILFRGSGLSSSDYRIVFSTSDENTMKINGYRANVLRPLPASGDATVGLTLTVTHKEMPSVSFTKTLDYTVKALDEAEIDEDVAFLELVEKGLFDALAEGQDAAAVTTDLHPFQRAYFDGEGTLHWQYAADDTTGSQYPIGFSRQTVATNPSSDASYSYFVSSHPGIVADSTLRVTRPAHDIGVSVTCCFSSERFGQYYERYASDAACPDELKEKFKKLARQLVSCQFTVKGTQVSSRALEELADAADAAEALMGEVVVSQNGIEVFENELWVDPATAETLSSAIVRARTIAESSGATESTVQDALAALDEARAAFQAACKPGLLKFASDEALSALASEASAAEALMANVYSSADGADVYTSRKWAPPAVIDRLWNAIDAARALAKGPAPTADVALAFQEIAIARTDFTANVRNGKKAEPKPAGSSSASGSGSSSATPSSGGGSSSPSAKPASSAKPKVIGGVKAKQTYAAGSGKSRAAYKIATCATTARQGTVWYAYTKLAKATAAEAVVPATVKIKGGTYRVVGVKPGAFKGMKKLSRVTIGANVAKVSPSAVKACPKVKTIVVRSKKLASAASVKGALRGSKAGAVTVKVYASALKAGKKIYTKANLAAPKAVSVQKIKS